MLCLSKVSLTQNSKSADCDSIIKFSLFNKSKYGCGQICDKKKTGEWKYFSEGRLLKIENYNNGLLDGTSYYYSEDNILYQSLNFKEGKLNGLANFYSKNGELLATYDYVNNILHGVLFYIIDPESPSKEHGFKPKL